VKNNERHWRRCGSFQLTRADLKGGGWGVQGGGAWGGGGGGEGGRGGGGKKKKKKKQRVKETTTNARSAPRNR